MVEAAEIASREQREADAAREIADKEVAEANEVRKNTRPPHTRIRPGMGG
jgi:hypothetical protein